MSTDKRVYFTIEIFYKKTPADVEGQLLFGLEVCKYRLQNCTAAHVKDFRFTVFQEGFLIWADADTGYIVPPGNITHIEVYRQAKFFSDSELNKPLKKTT